MKFNKIKKIIKISWNTKQKYKNKVEELVLNVKCKKLNQKNYNLIQMNCIDILQINLIIHI